MKLYIALIIFFISSCSTVNMHLHNTGWSYSVTFLSNDNTPIVGVNMNCTGNKHWVSDSIVKEINDKNNFSDKNGLITFYHDGYSYSKSYSQLGPFTWGHSKQYRVQCNFLYNNEIIETGYIEKYAEHSIVIVNAI